MKNSSKREHSDEDLEGKILEKKEENQCLTNHNQELQNQIKELETEKKIARGKNKKDSES